MAKFGWDERRLFYVSEVAVENLSGTPSDADTGQMLIYIKSDHLYIKKPTVSEVIMPETASNIGGGFELFKQKNSNAELEFRTFLSGNSFLDFTQNANDLTLTIDTSDLNNDLDHGALLGLADDDHLQYLLLAGRSGGQTANGGTGASENLTLGSTANATKGAVQITDGSDFRHNSALFKEYEVTTTDATITTIATVALSDDTIYFLRATILGRRTDGGGQDRSISILEAAAYRAAAGAATLQGSVQQQFQKESAGGLDTNIVVSGNNVLVQVTGIAAQTFDWKLRLELVAQN